MAIDKKPAQPRPPSGLHLVSDPATGQEFRLPDTVAGWTALFEQLGQKAQRSGVVPGFDEPVYVDCGRALAQMLVEHPDFAEPFAAKGLGPAFFAAVGTCAERLAATTAAAPPDRRRWEQLTPDQKREVAATADLVVGLRSSVAEVAGADGREGAKALGRGLRVNRHSLESVRTAVETFLAGAPRRGRLLFLAGIGAQELATLQRHQQKLDQLIGDKGGAKRSRARLATELAGQSLVLQCAFQFYRGRVRNALDHDPVRVGQALAVLPRNLERRRAASTPKPAPIPA